MTFYITFGFNHKDKNGNSLAKAFVVLNTATEMEAREKMFMLRGQAWSMIYTTEEFEGQVEKYNLHEVNLYEL